MNEFELKEKLNEQEEKKPEEQEINAYIFQITNRHQCLHCSKSSSQLGAMSFNLTFPDTIG
jgi:hypothetical protein